MGEIMTFVKYYIERYVKKQGWIRQTSDLDSLQMADNIRKFLAQAWDEDISNFSIMVKYE